MVTQEEDPTSEWAQGGGGLRAVEIRESWVELEWERVADAVPGEEPMFYEVGVWRDVLHSSKIIFHAGSHSLQ